MENSKYRLYGDTGSGSAVVELALAEVGAAVELVDVSLETARQRDSAYRDVNPQRKLPTLVTPEGEILTESAAILLYLADSYPKARLLPAIGDSSRAKALRWLVFVAAELYPLIEIIDYPERFYPAGIRQAADSGHVEDEALREHVREIWKSRWKTLEAGIGESDDPNSPWVLEDGFSLVDIYVAVVSRWADLADWRAAHLPRVETIAAAVARRKRCAGVWKRHFDSAEG